MRVRVRVLIPLVAGGLVAVGFVVAAVAVAGAVREALTTVPGITADRAVESAVRVAVLVGLVSTVVAAAAAALVGRVVVRGLERTRSLVEGADGSSAPGTPTPLMEIQELRRSLVAWADEARRGRDRVARDRERLRQLVDAVSEGIIEIDRDGRVAGVNRAGRELFHFPEEAVGRPVGALFRRPELRKMLEASSGGGGGRVTEVEVGDRTLLVSVSPRPDDGAVATFVDVTDLRRMEAVRRDFVANASHELKTPITSIRGYAETLLTDPPSDDGKQEFLETIARNARRLQRIVDDLLDLSRLEAGHWVPDMEAVDPAAVARSAWAPFVDRAVQAGITFHLEAGTADRVLADAGALEQVFSNLYDNALRHTPEGGRISVGIENAAESRLAIEVSDTGSGIPRDELPRVFERFYRVDPARSRAEGGTGLGLSIVRHMIENMNGSVDATSELGTGTTVRVVLPTP